MNLTGINCTTSYTVSNADKTRININNNSVGLLRKHADETNINRSVDNFMQGGSTNCAFLARLKNMSRKSWGKKYVKNCIKPDGKGGAFIIYPGAKGNQKQFHITKDDIIAARKEQKKTQYIDRNNNIATTAEFSTGDDDVLALEIASERPMYYESNPIKLITGKTFHSFNIENQNTADFVLKKMKNNFDNYVINIGFKDNSFGLKAHHAYEIIGLEKDKNNNPMIRLCNPWNTSEEIVINYYDALSSMDRIEIYENPDKHLSWFENLTDINTEDYDIKAMQKYYKQKMVNEGFAELKKIIQINNNQKRIDKINEYLKNANHYHINQILQYKITDIITLMDNAEFGLGHGKNKKELISALVEYVRNEAWQKNVDENIINKFKKECYNELDSVLYVNEKNIINSFKSILLELNKVHAPKVQNGYIIIRIK